MVNHLFNSTFDWLSEFPGGPISDLMAGALVLVRRTLFFVPEGVTASQTTNGLTVSVNTGSVAYFRQDGTSVQVSGDPGFWGAETYVLAKDQTVAVSNPGNAGCAGFVFTSGTVGGNLSTSQIDSIRFEDDSAFAGRVDATVVGRPLSLRDAVRGLSGVDLDAAVVLGNDVEVDAGIGDAVFAGTVDAAKKGKQSLTVTALGTTFFKQAVGGVTPLASLLTQGIAPLTIAQSRDSKTIPLHFLPEQGATASSSPGVKYGIDVAIGDNPSQVYEFDTGGTGFFAGYNQPFWKNVPLTTTPANETYNSGNYFNGVVSNTKVTLGQGKQTVSTAQPIAIGAVLQGGNATKQTTFDFTNPEVPPVEGQFFGDFGASLAVSDGLTNPLLQLPGNLANGFLVQLGPIGVAPQLTVGVTDELRAQFPYAVPVILSPQGGTYPTSGYPVLDQFGFAPEYYVTRDGKTEPLGTELPANITCADAKQCLPTLIDSGAPTTGVRLNSSSPTPYATEDGSQLKPGTTFKAVFPTNPDRLPLTWEFTAGDNASVDEVKYQTPKKAGAQENVNVGLTLYNYYDVMFDIPNKTIWLRPTGAQSDVVLGSVTTTGDQTYRQNAQLGGTYTTTRNGSFSVAGVTTLGADTSVDTGRGDVTFSGTVDNGGTAGPRPTLTVTTDGATNFVRQVGGQSPLGGLVVDGGGPTKTAGVTTTRGQTYSGDASLTGVYSVNSGTFSVGRATTLTGPVAVYGGDIDFGGPVDALAGKGFQLSLNPGAGKTATITGDVGSTNPLGGLEISATGKDTATLTAPGRVTLRGDLGFASDKGIDIGDNVAASFTGGGLIQNFSGAGVIVGAANPSVIEGFAISGNGKEGIRADGATGLEISDNAISGNGGDGISVTGGKGATIAANSITGNGTSASSATATAAGGTINANGIYLSGAEKVSIVDNSVTANGVGATVGGNDLTTYANGIYADGCTNMAITSNTITGNGTGASTDANLTVFSAGVLSDNSTPVQITDNVISANGSDGVEVKNGASNAILSNSIFGNNGKGISLSNGNGDQPAPLVNTAKLGANSQLVVDGTVYPLIGYMDDFELQVFYSPSTDAPDVQGRQLIFTKSDVAAGPFSYSITVPSGVATGGYVTATVTPTTGASNTSKFSGGTVIAGDPAAL